MNPSFHLSGGTLVQLLLAAAIVFMCITFLSSECGGYTLVVHDGPAKDTAYGPIRSLLAPFGYILR